MWSVVVAALVASAEPPTVDVFLDSDRRVPRSVESSREAREVARTLWVSQWEPRTGTPTSLWFPAPPAGARTPKDLGLTAEESARRALLAVAPLFRQHPAELARLTRLRLHDVGDGAVVVSFGRVVDGVPVFRERLAVVLDEGLQPVGVLGHVSPHPAPAMQFPLAASTALSFVLNELEGANTAAVKAPRFVDSGWARFEGGHLARRILYATDDALEPAWRLEVESSRGPFTVIVSARDGRLLSRASRTSGATHGYRVWAKPTAPFTPHDSPFGDLGPHPTGLPDGWAPAMLTAADLVRLDHAGVATMDPWLPAGATSLSGNNAVAFADVFAPNGRNDPAAGLPRLPDGGVEPGTPLPDGGTTRGQVDPFPAPTAATFDFPWDPQQAPTAAAEQSLAAATHAFYVANWLHDLLYDVGFTEAAGNTQLDNRGRGGSGGDPLVLEVNDFAQAGVSRFIAAPDGVSPRIELFAPAPFGRSVVTFLPGLGVDAGAGAPPMRDGAWNVSGRVVRVESLDGGFDVCGPYRNAAQLGGAIAFARASGPCGSVAGLDDLPADAGALGLLLANAFDTREPGITVPTHALDADRASALFAALDAGAAVTATLERAPELARSAAFDSTVIAHEVGHLLATRLTNDGLLGNQARALAEGTGDYLALLAFLDDGDGARAGNANWRGAFAVGAFSASARAYDGADLNSGLFGLRRFPYAQELSRNGLTLKHIVANVPLPMSPASPLAPPPAQNAIPQNAGEVWAAALWDGASRVLADTQRFSTVTAARRRLLTLLVATLDAMPPNATFVEARDAALMTARATSANDFTAFLDGFAARGLGLAAQAFNRRSLTNAPVAEDFSATGARWAVLDVRVVDEQDSCDNDGVLDVAERGRLEVTLMNVGSRPIVNSRINLGSDEDVLILSQAMATVPTTEPFATVRLTQPVELRNEIVGIAQSRVFLASQTDGFVEQTPVTRAVRLNTDLTASARETFEGDLSRWEFGRQDVPWDFQFRPNNPSGRLLQTDLFGPNAPVAGLSWATSPPMQVGTEALSFSFEQSYGFEAQGPRGFDGAQLRLSVDGAPFELIPGTAITRTLAGATFGGYDGTLEPGTSNPLAGQPAFFGVLATQRVVVDLGTRYANRTIRLQFLIGTDAATSSTGWLVDDLEVLGVTMPPFLTPVVHRRQCINKPPLIQTLLPLSVDERTRVTLLPPATTDPNGDPLTFRWRQTSGPAVTLMGAEFDAPEVRRDTGLTLVVTADDGKGGTAEAQLAVTVKNVNRPPTSSAGPSVTVRSGETVRLEGAASDPDDDPLVIRWSQLGGPPVTFSSVDALDATFVAPVVGTLSEVNLELNVSDGPATAPPARVTILVAPRGCGCSGAEGLGLLSLGLLLLRRRRA